MIDSEDIVMYCVFIVLGILLFSVFSFMITTINYEVKGQNICTKNNYTNSDSGTGAWPYHIPNEVKCYNVERVIKADTVITIPKEKFDYFNIKTGEKIERPK